MARRFRSRGVTRAPRSKKTWIGVEIAPGPVAANAAVLFGILNAEAIDQLPFTVLRSRGVLIMESDQEVLTEDFGGAFAMVHTTQRATAAGIGSVDNPFGNSSSGNFFVWEPIYSKVFQQGGAAVGSQTSAIFPVDSKAMRKLVLGDDIAFVFEALDLSGLNVGFMGRVLIQLH